MHLIVEGIDGAGKGTVARILRQELEKHYGPAFDVPAFSKEKGSLPDASAFEGYRLVVTAEPTYAWVGSAIRAELTRNTTTPYSPQAIAEAFALDRLIHYQRIVLPARAQGAFVLQDRSVASSLAYQSLTSPSLTFAAIAELEGNAHALAHAPDILLILNLPPEKALERLTIRTDKKDYSIYEKRSFLEQLDAQYRARELRAYFERGGTRIIDFSTADELAIMETKVQKLAATLF